MVSMVVLGSLLYITSLLSQVCEQGCAALCVLALRKPNNCKVIMENGGALAALQAMKTHPAEANVQVKTQRHDMTRS